MRKRNRSLKQLPRSSRSRRGVALFIVTIFIVAVGVLALTAIVTTGNATLISKSYARENDLRYSAEAALAIGKSRINFDAEALPDTGYVTLMSEQELTTADNQTIQGVKVTVYAGPSGSTSGQFGRFASIVAVAKDQQGNGFIRRLELTQESFAKYAYWSAQERSSSGSTIVFGASDVLWGPVWSNDTIRISGTAGAIFNDDVATARIVTNAGNATFKKGYRTLQPLIQLPSTADLDAKLGGFGAAAGWSFTPPTNGSASGVRARVEFVAIDLNADGDSTDANEGFFKVYVANTSQAGWLRGNWPNSAPSVSDLKNCGDYHYGKFYPASVHPTQWFDDQMDSLGMTNTEATNERNASATSIMNKAGSRCFLGGAPQLSAAGRTSGLGYGVAARQKGGDDTTFSATDQYGAWVSAYPTGTPPTAISSVRPWDAMYLFPISRTFNPLAKGVIYANGTIGVSGTLRGKVTLYATGSIVILDDQRYTIDPGTGTCGDMLGLLSAHNITVADNAILGPALVKWSSGDVWRNLDDTKDAYIQAVVMALDESFGVENYDEGTNNANDCEGSDNGRGCLYLTGGLIQSRRGAVGTTGGYGYTKRYSYDRCAIVNPPPYFPTTGRFTDNRYYELNPVGFNAAALYQSITVDQ